MAAAVSAAGEVVVAAAAAPGVVLEFFEVFLAKFFFLPSPDPSTGLQL